LLGKFELMGIPPAARGIPRIVVKFDVDANGILNCTAKDESTGKSTNITIRNEKGRLSKLEIERMINDAEKFKEEDETARHRVHSRNTLESYLYNVSSVVNDYSEKFNDKDKQTIDQILKDKLYWIKNNQNVNSEIYESTYKEVELVVGPIMQKLYQNSNGNGVSGPKIEEVN
ncbi:unnamed protein product, partial [Didymodactylos carnosus]